MPEPIPVALEKGQGINTTDSLFTLPPNVTDDLLNVDGDGTILCAKRYGMTQPINTAMTGPIFDIAFFAPWGGVALFDLLVLFRVASQVQLGRHTISGNFTSVGFGPDDDAMVGFIVPAGDNIGLIAGPLSFSGNARYINHTGQFGGYTLSSYFGPGTNSRTDVMAYHRLSVFAARQNTLAPLTPSNASRIYFSQEDAPLTWPASNFVDAHNRGRYPNIDGLAGTGEVLYAGSTGSGVSAPGVYALTGSSKATYRLDKTNSSFGFAGSKTCDALGNVLMGFSAGLHTDETNFPRDIFMASGLRVELIGRQVQSIIRNTSAWAYRDAKTKAWPDREAVLFMPRRSGASAAARDLLYFHAISRSFWKWTLPSAVSPNCFEHLGDMWVGCQDGRVRRFVSTAANDDGTTFNSYWSSGPMQDPDGFETKVVRILVTGKQTSGGVSTIDVSRNGAAYAGALTFTLPTTTGTVEINCPDTFGSAYYNRVRFTFPTDGVGCRIDRAVVYIKRVGRTGNT